MLLFVGSVGVGGRRLVCNVMYVIIVGHTTYKVEFKEKRMDRWMDISKSRIKQPN